MSMVTAKHAGPGVPEPAPSQPLPASEIVAVLRQIARGEIAIELADPNQLWDPEDQGQVTIRAAGYEIVLFNDHGALDYVDRARAPDGRSGSFEVWWAYQQEPTQQLSSEDVQAIERACSTRRASHTAKRPPPSEHDVQGAHTGDPRGAADAAEAIPRA